MPVIHCPHCGKPVPIRESVADAGSRGGKAKAAKLTPAERSELAKRMNAARWGNRSN